jgi:hypothetical protein
MAPINAIQSSKIKFEGNVSKRTESIREELSSETLAEATRRELSELETPVWRGGMQRPTMGPLSPSIQYRWQYGVVGHLRRDCRQRYL